MDTGFRHCPKKIVLKVQRCIKPGDNGSMSPWQPSCDDLDLSACSSSDEEWDSSLFVGDHGHGGHDVNSFTDRQINQRPIPVKDLVCCLYPVTIIIHINGHKCRGAYN